MSEIAHRKQELRRFVLRTLSRMTAEDRRLESERLCNQLRRILGHPKGRCLLGYSPMRTEPDLTDFYNTWTQLGGVLCLPRKSISHEGYEPAAAHPSGPGLTIGAFGISEPSPEASVIPWSQLDFVMVPGLAFDHNGNRLGRGKGFYDRMLQSAGGEKLGIAFSVQQMGIVPVERHDVGLDGVVWADGLMPVTEVGY